MRQIPSFAGKSRIRIIPAPRTATPSNQVRIFHSPRHLSNPRPLVPFLSPPRSVQRTVRYFSAERKNWLRHEAKIFLRFNLTVWGIAVSAFAIWYLVAQEMLERDYPTPHEWPYRVRKTLRDAKKWMDGSQGGVDWVRTLSFARATMARLETPGLASKHDIEGLIQLESVKDPRQEFDDEFTTRDISAKSEEWRRGYFETLMLTASAAENLDGWLADKKQMGACPPEYVVGPSNPKPKPMPPGSPPPFREEDCVVAFPSADRWYIKALGTKGFTPRQRMEIGIAYALFMDYRNRSEEALNLYQFALDQVTAHFDLPTSLPYDPKTFILKPQATGTHAANLPSENILTVLTAIANHKARSGQTPSALPIYLSILQARRSLPDTDPNPTLAQKSKARLPVYQQITELLSQPDYPPPPPSGDSPPAWRSPFERCQEAGLSLYIGEILYAGSPSGRESGLSWTRDGVDMAEGELRGLPKNLKSVSSKADYKQTRAVCRECLSTGLDNWKTMASRLSREEREKNKGQEGISGSGSSGGVLSFFWSGDKKESGAAGGVGGQGRWEAEERVVEERIRRTLELVEDLKIHEDGGLARVFRA